MPLGNQIIAVYTSASSTPQATLIVGRNQGPQGIAIDKYGNIWTASNSRIDEYKPLPADARGSITLASIKTIGGPRTHLKGIRGLVVDPKSGYIYASNYSSILAFYPDDGGNVAPLIELTGVNHQFKYPYSVIMLTIDHEGRVVVCGGANAIFIFAPLATGKAGEGPSH